LADLPLIADRYQLLERLGAGGMGEVWKAQDVRFESRFVALKLLKDDETHRQDAENRTKLQRSLRDEASRGPLTIESVEGLLDEVLRAGKGADALHTHVKEKADSRGHLSPDTAMALFDELVGNPTCSENARTRARLRKLFRDEANAVANLRHDNIVGISDYGEYNGLPFLTMSYIEGPTLARVIQRRVPLTRQRQLELMENLCAGLAHAHAQKLVHRDIKPANLIIDEVTGSLKILDFGVVRRLRAQSESTVGVAIGTLCYMSPEQIRGASVDHRSDIFSVGDVFYELLSRKMAFPPGEGGLEMVDLMQRIQHAPPRPIRELVPDIEPEIEEILSKALEKNVDDRYQSLVDMQHDLARLRSELENQNRTVRVRTPSAGAERLIRGAEAALADADAVRALELLNQALASDPSNTEAARLRLRAQELAKEQAERESAARVLAERVARAVAEGNSLLAEHKAEDALAKAREAIALNRSDNDALDLSRRANAELRRLADVERAEQFKRDEASRRAEAARQAEERRQADEARAQREAAAKAEAARREHEEAKRTAERRQAEEERARREAAEKAEALRKEEEAARLAAEARRQAEAHEREVAAAKAEAARQQQDAARLAKERRLAAERAAAEQAEVLRKEQEAAARADEERQAAEQRRQEAADRRRRAAEFVATAEAARSRQDFQGAIQNLETAAVLTPDDRAITDQLARDREALALATAAERRREALNVAFARVRARLDTDETKAAREALDEAAQLEPTDPRLADLHTAIQTREAALAAHARDEAAAHEARRRETVRKWKQRWPLLAAALVAAVAIPTAIALWRSPQPVAPIATPVPAPPLMSLVSIDIRPWAHVRIAGLGTATPPDHADPYVTPFLVSLAPGKYRLDCENGGLTPNASFEITVEAGQPLHFSQAMTTFDPDQLVTKLLGPGK
jgi:serine/threonine protein kinase